MATIETATTETGSEPAGAPAPGAGPRSLMVRKLTDIVVLPASRVSANERALTADILLQVIDKVEIEYRIEIARRVSRIPETPPALLRMLLLDEPEVAGPVIRWAESVPEALLIECARAGKIAHREMIARRIDLTTSVADVLIEFNEPAISKLLLRRDEFTLSPGAVDLLVARSAGDAEAQMLLLRRRELEPAHGFIMFWWVDGERRRRILSRFMLDRSIIQDTLKDLYPVIFRDEAPDAFVKEILVMLDRRHRPRGENGDPVSMDVVRKTLGAARRVRVDQMVHAVSMIAGVTRELSARMLRDPGGEPYAILCKAMGVSRDHFFAFVSGDDPAAEGAITPERAEALLAVFDSISRDFARAVLRYWDWSGNPRIARIRNAIGSQAAPTEPLLF